MAHAPHLGCRGIRWAGTEQEPLTYGNTKNKKKKERKKKHEKLQIPHRRLGPENKKVARKSTKIVIFGPSSDISVFVRILERVCGDFFSRISVLEGFCALCQPHGIPTLESE